MNKPVDCCWLLRLRRRDSSRNWSKHCRSLQLHQSHHAFLWQRVQQSADACCSRSSFWERLGYSGRGICAATQRMGWHCSPGAHGPMAIATPKPFCHRWLLLVVPNATLMLSRAEPHISGIRPEKLRELSNSTR